MELTVSNDLEENKCFCGKESEVGVHQVSDGIVVSFYHCLTCYNKKGKNV